MNNHKSFSIPEEKSQQEQQTPTLDSLALKDDDKVVLEKLLDTTGMEAKYVSREEFNAKKGSIIDGLGKEKQEKATLFLPNDMKMSELPGIIKRINTLTMGKNLPKFASSNELKGKILVTFNSLIELSHSDIGKKQSEEVNKAITKFYKLYADLFPGEERNLNNPEYRENTLKELDSAKQQEYADKLKSRLSQIKELEKQEDGEKEEDLNNILAGLEGDISQELLGHLDESIFEKGVNDLRTGLELATKAIQKELMLNAEAEGYEMIINKKWGNNGKILYLKDGKVITIRGLTKNEFINHLKEKGYVEKKNDEGTVLLVNKEGKEVDISKLPERDEGLDDLGPKLRDKIGIDELKSNLDNIRKNGNPEEIAKMEFDATNKILHTIYHNINYQQTNNGAAQNTMNQKGTQCLGFSIIGHSLLGELGINHEGVSMPFHSVLKINIGDNSYIFDGANKDKLLRITGETKIGEGNTKKMELENGEKVADNMTYTSGDAEKVLIMGLINNHLDWNDPKKSLKLLERGERIFKDPFFLTSKAKNLLNLAFSKKDLKMCEEVIQITNEALKLNPELANAYEIRGMACHFSNKVDQGIESYEKCLALKPDSNGSLDNLHRLYLEKGKKINDPSQRLSHYEKTLKLFPNDGSLLFQKGFALYELGKQDIASKTFYDAAMRYNGEGDLENATTSINNAVNLNPDNKEAQELKAKIEANNGTIENQTPPKITKQREHL